MLSAAVGAPMLCCPACRSRRLTTWKLSERPDPAGLPRCVLLTKRSCSPVVDFLKAHHKELGGCRGSSAQ